MWSDFSTTSFRQCIAAQTAAYQHSEHNLSIVAYPWARELATLSELQTEWQWASPLALHGKNPLYHGDKPWATTVYPGFVVNHRVQLGAPWAGTMVRTSGCRYQGNHPTAPW